MSYCPGCGKTDCPGGCTNNLDPPRFCARCGTRLAVQVFPSRVVTRCPKGHSSPA